MQVFILSDTILVIFLYIFLIIFLPLHDDVTVLGC